jgi:phospholipase A1
MSHAFGRSLGLLGVALAAAAPALALERSALEVCARLDDSVERLLCFDRLVPKPAAASGEPNAAVVPVEVGSGSPIGDRWAIGVPAGETLFDIRPHKPTYILGGRWTDSVNQRPSSPTLGTQPATAEPLRATEAKFQISFKFKLADFGDSLGASLWGGYSQQSQWQVYNAALSRPFRETNYEPELMLAFHPDLRWAGWRLRLINLGLVHQSNGRNDPISRSWNRAYAQFAAERGNLVLTVRPWVRFKEKIEEDNNPDITRFLGHGDVLLSWRSSNGHALSALGRYNANSGKGALTASWSFPLLRRVTGHVQVFSGYGESLIDYNWRQTTIGLGVALADWY